MGFLAKFFEWIYNAITGAWAKITAAVALLASGLSALVTIWSRIVSALATFSGALVSVIDDTVSYSQSLASGVSANPMMAIYMDLFGLDYLVQTSVSVIGSIIGVITLVVSVFILLFGILAIMFTYKWAVRTIKVISLSSVQLD